MKYDGILHHYHPRHVAFQFDKIEKPEKVLIFIGGLTDGLLTVPYVPQLSKKLSEECGFSTIQLQFTSSFGGWGTSSLKQDVEDMECLIEYLKTEIGVSKIILMGHSTGSQDVFHYILNGSVKVDGGIMQAGVSDREADDIDSTEEGRAANNIALDLLKQGKGATLLSEAHRKVVFNTPITAYRWNSLMNKGGDDDYFSSDLTEQELKFDKIDVPFLVAFSEKDEFVREKVDKAKLIKYWEKNSDPKCWSRYSGLVKDANHNVWNPAVQDHLFEKVIGFINEFSL